MRVLVQLLLMCLVCAACICTACFVITNLSVLPTLHIYCCSNLPLLLYFRRQKQRYRFRTVMPNIFDLAHTLRTTTAITEKKLLHHAGVT